MIKIHKDVFVFAELQKEVTYGLGYKITLTRNGDSSVLNKTNATNNAKNEINGIEWYVPHYTTSMEQQKMKSEQILSKVPTEIHYVKKSIFMNEVKTRNIWTFELGTQEGENFPIWVIVGFQQRDGQYSQN